MVFGYIEAISSSVAGFPRLHECMRSCCRQSHRIVPAAVPLFDEYHTNSEYLSNMRGHVEIIQVHNIMAVESEAGTRRTAHCSITALRL